MTYEVREYKTSLATCDTMAEALAVVRQRIEGMAPYEAAMSDLAIVKRDARGRVRREVSSRDLVALALGEPRLDLFPSERGWAILDDAVAAGSPVELALVPEGAMREAERRLPEPQDADSDPSRDPVAWLVRLTLAGQTGWTLWFDGDPDALLARNGRVPVFGSLDALSTAIAREAGSFSPPAVAGIDAPSLRSVLEAPPAVVDFDGAAAWLSSPDREVTIEACDGALNALNMAIDVGATVGDCRLADLVESPALAGVHDALTFGLTLLGDGSPYRDDPAAMTTVITPESADAVASLISIVRGHLDPLAGRGST